MQELTDVVHLTIMGPMQGSSMIKGVLEKIVGDQTFGVSLVCMRGNDVSCSQIHGVEVNTPVQVGCVAKTLTSILAAYAQMEGLLKLDDRLAEYFPVSGKFSDIALGHLLNQTSGVDQSMITTLPRCHNGLINRQALLAQLESSALLSRPGTMFHYGNLGPWLVAAILEKQYELSYADLLERLIFDPLGISAPGQSDAAEICPSMGMGLKLSAQDLLRIISLHLDGSPDHPALAKSLESLRSTFGFRLSGSVMMAVRACPGWFDYGSSFGQLGHGEHSAAVIRFVPDQKMVIAITTDHPQLANVALAILFRDTLSEFSVASGPRLMTAEEWAQVDPYIYTGCYENGRYRMWLDIARNGALRARVYGKTDETPDGDSEPGIKRYFKPAVGNSFIPAEPEPQVCPVLNFSSLHDDATGFRYISTGRYVFTRSDQWQRAYGS